MKKLRKIIMLMLVAVMLVVPTTASAFYGVSVRCPKCNMSNNSYGSRVDAKRPTTGCSPGAYCPGCSKIVPEGEYHTTVRHYDLHYFMCESNSCRFLSANDRTYTELIETGEVNHSINRY